MPKRKLKVRRKEDPAQVPESSSSCLPHLLRSVAWDWDELPAYWVLELLARPPAVSFEGFTSVATGTESPGPSKE